MAFLPCAFGRFRYCIVHPRTAGHKHVGGQRHRLKPPAGAPDGSAARAQKSPQCQTACGLQGKFGRPTEGPRCIESEAMKPIELGYRFSSKTQ
jgi:hypothetical protein